MKAPFKKTSLIFSTDKSKNMISKRKLETEFSLEWSMKNIKDISKFKSISELLDEVEAVLKIDCAPVTWPIGMGSLLKGVYHLLQDKIYVYTKGQRGKISNIEVIDGLDSDAAKLLIGDDLSEYKEEIDIVKGASPSLDIDAYLKGTQTPVFFGSAISNFGIKELLDEFIIHAPAPISRESDKRIVEACEDNLTGFIFKIQANMNPSHRDRIAFMRICSGEFKNGIKLMHIRSGKEMKIGDAITFMASDRQHTDKAYAGDIIGIHNHGTINIGDSFTQGELLNFSGIPNFAPEIFRRVILRDPLRLKALLKGLDQLCEEGATQFFRPINKNDLILGAVGLLQFDVVAHRLLYEYKVECEFETISIAKARWIECADQKVLREFTNKMENNLALDHSGRFVYIAPSKINLNLTEERWPEILFLSTREQ